MRDTESNRMIDIELHRKMDEIYKVLTDKDNGLFVQMKEIKLLLSEEDVGLCSQTKKHRIVLFGNGKLGVVQKQKLVICGLVMVGIIASYKIIPGSFLQFLWKITGH